MNRFDNITPSAYSPQSFEELAFVPMLKRRKHDELISQQELVRAGLAKVDPLDVHLEEASRLKQGIESQLDNTAVELSQKGINNDMIGKTIALNRQYQNLVAPTGRIGQINAAKIAEAAEYKKFIDSPELKEYGLDAKEKAWQRHRAQYLGYDDKNNITNINALSGPKYQDLQKDFMELSGRLGEQTRTYLKNTGAHFQEGPFGGLIMVSGDGKTINTNNDPNLKALAETLSAKYIDSKGEGYKSREFAGFDLKNTVDQLNGMLGIPRVDKTVKDMNYNYNFINDPNAKTSSKDENSPDATYDNTSTVNLEKNVGNTDFSQIGKPKNNAPIGSSPSVAGSGVGSMGYGKSGIQTYKDIITDPFQQKLYEISYDRLVKNGRIKKGENINSNETAKKIGFYMKNHLKFPTIGNDVIRPDITPEAQLFMGALPSKDKNARNATLEQDVRGNNDNPSFRQMVDAETGEKVTLGDGEKIEYIGYDSPINYRAYNFNNKLQQNVSAHKAQILDKDGNFVRNVAIGRTKNEMETPQFKQMYEINHVYRNAVNKLGEWVKPTGNYSGSKQVKNYSIKYTDDGKFILKHDGYPESEPMDVPTFQLNMRQILSE